MFMRSTSALYRHACEEEGCVLHTELVKLFHGVDVALQTAAADPLRDASALREEDDSTEEDAAITPLPPALTDSLLIAFRPNLCYPTHITLSKTHLGDAGMAAFFRVLPMLRWLRVVDARGIGAGPRSIDALCNSLVAYLVEGCEEAPAMRLAETEEADAGRIGGVDRHPLAGRLPALELVDLRDNDAIFTLSVEKIIAVLRTRRGALLRWCAKEGERNLDAIVLPPLEVYVDAANLLPTTAHSLQAWNAEAAAVKLRREVAAGEQRWKEQLRIFTVPREAAEGPPCGMQPVGEHVVFRVPLAEEEQEGKGAERISLTHAANALRRSINAHMPQFLSASCMLAPLTDVATDSSLHAAAQGARAALQLCADFGADALDILFYSNAALWCGARIRQQEQQHTLNAHYQALATTEVSLLEAQRSIAALLRALEVCPTLEEELLSSQASGGVVVDRHLRRLRELHRELQGAAQNIQQPEGHFKEMISLYHRIVAALVTPHFSDGHVPSMMACEQRIAEVAEHVLGHLVVGTDDAERLATMVRRLRSQAQEYAALPERLTEEDGAAKHTKDFNLSRLLPPIMATSFYHIQDNPEAEELWRQTYAGTSEAVASAVKEAFATVSEIPEVMQAFHSCHCAAKLESSAATGDNSGSYPEPCTTCSYRALTSVQDALRDAEQGSGELLFRWETLEPVRHALPRELRMFFLDMMVRQRSGAQGGCVYVPPFDSLQQNESGVDSAERWSMMAWLACSHHQEAYWVELLRVYAQWYRLRAVEFYGQPEAQKLMQSSM
ncbi:hypothetical protein ABL78_6580 [Leptomonas seymouri]|uniref:Uncharacterized protein n=1 Tax=Leptomonas seymouri TaxID=5684 RepID=A0A0N1I1U0_LEPSE|nr:hypothetical protein ABL78_6580 [Leptomonas seymouri]|eukprot:KPI84373.1 hypothetical protein ABL78_6580 [Leptomonas seymouri]